MLIPGADGGKVSGEPTKLARMIDFLVVSHTHPMMLDSDDVIAQLIFFLQHGRFDAA
jgi:triacylglycerol lipase